MAEPSPDPKRPSPPMPAPTTRLPQRPPAHSDPPDTPVDERSPLLGETFLAPQLPDTVRAGEPGATRVVPPPDLGDLQRGRKDIPFGRYRLLEELGRGGMGVVWKALDTQLQRVVALKQILAPRASAEDTRVERFLREARLAAKLRHPNILTVHDVAVHAGQPYFTTDYIDGESLDKRMRSPIELRRAVAWVRAAAEALAHAHQEGVMHRDVKPANLLLDRAGQIYVMDFGLAREVN
ncbi:MAG: protein kinase, partial [Planctomycetes bacterium]|nr:protein kinase [Planctomycetota bacterium]